MTTRIAKEEMALMMPGSIGHYFKDDPSDMPIDQQAPGLLARLGKVFAYLAEMPRRRAAMAELTALSEHELADIGLTRSELSMVFDPDFAAARNKDRAANSNRQASPARAA